MARYSLALLSERLSIHLVSADTHGHGSQTATSLGVNFIRVDPGAESHQKRRFVERLGRENVVAVGGGANDRQMLEAAALGIAVLGSEGMAVASLTAADVVVGSIQDALDILLKAQRLVATLRR